MRETLREVFHIKYSDKYALFIYEQKFGNLLLFNQSLYNPVDRTLTITDEIKRVRKTYFDKAMSSIQRYIQNLDEHHLSLYTNVEQAEMSLYYKSYIYVHRNFSEQLHKVISNIHLAVDDLQDNQNRTAYEISNDLYIVVMKNEVKFERK